MAEKKTSSRSRSSTTSTKSKGNQSNKRGVPVGINQVHLRGTIASATTSRAGILSRRLEVTTEHSREILDIECENTEFFKVFRSLKVGDVVNIEGMIRRRFWRTGTGVVSRSYVEIHGVKPR